MNQQFKTETYTGPRETISGFEQEDRFNALRFVSEARENLKKLGLVKLTVETDFDRYVNLASVRQRHVVWQQFDPARLEHLCDRAVWICGRNSAGEIVHIQAMRCDELADTNLQEHLQTLLPKLDGGFAHEMAPRTREITGRVVYHGGLWVDRSIRSAQIGSWTARLGVGEAFLRWCPNWIYGYVDQWMAASGFGLRMSYTHMQRHVLRWEQEPDYETDYFMCSSSRDDLRWLMAAGHAPYVLDQ